MKFQPKRINFLRKENLFNINKKLNKKCSNNEVQLKAMGFDLDDPDRKLEFNYNLRNNALTPNQY